MQKTFDIVIIGGGTTGLFATYYATMRGLDVLLIESQQRLGGKVMQFFPEKLIYDVGGLPEILGEQLVKQMEKQARRHQPPVVVGQFVTNIDQQEDGFTLTTSTKEKYQAKKVLLATGAGTFHAKRPEEWDALSPQSFKETVPTTLDDLVSYTDKHVVITGNSKVNVSWALYVSKVASEVTIINNQQTFQHITEEEQEALQNAQVNIYKNTKIKDFLIENDTLTGMIIKETSNHVEQTIKADCLITYNGISLQETPFTQWGIVMEKGRINVNACMETNVSGIFAAGDIVQYPGKTMLIATGYTDAMTAINHAHMQINPKAKEQVYSTVIYQTRK